MNNTINSIFQDALKHASEQQAKENENEDQPQDQQQPQQQAIIHVFIMPVALRV